MAWFKDFLAKFNSLPPEEREKYVEDSMPVIIDSENLAEAFELVYKTISDPWQYSNLEKYNDYLKDHGVRLLENHISGLDVWDLGAGKGMFWAGLAKVSNPMFYPKSVLGFEVSETAVNIGNNSPIKPSFLELIKYNLALPEMIAKLRLYKVPDVVYSCSFYYYLPAKIRKQLLTTICDIKPEVIITSATRWYTQEPIYIFPLTYSSEYKEVDRWVVKNPLSKKSNYLTFVYRRI